MEGFLNPEKVLEQLKLKKEMVAADFGCGSGGWAVPLARKLEEGKIYAIDILEEPLSALRARTRLEKIFNIEVIKSDIEKTSRLFPESCDLILMTNLLFEVKDKKAVLAEGRRVLKPGGRILVVDWREKAPLGPEKERVSPEEVKKIAKELNLKVEKEFKASPYHWGLIFGK